MKGKTYDRVSLFLSLAAGTGMMATLLRIDSRMTVNHLAEMKYLSERFSFMSMRLILCIGLFCLYQLAALGQPTDGLIAYYSFDACDASENTGTGADGIIVGNATCGCGVLGNGLEFDGNTTVQILGNLDQVFGADFTISFFMLAKPQGNQVMDILSKSETCGIDSTVEIRYNPSNREMSLTMSQNAILSARSRLILPADRCYHHIAFVRQDRNFIFYYDGIEKAKIGSTAFVEIINDGIFTLGGGPCLANGEVGFRGVLDELRIYNRALNAFEVQELYSPVDVITSPDTVLFTGTSMQVRLPVTCATSIQWTPATGVSNTTITEPILSPPATMYYFVNLDYGFCAANDSIHITIADSSDLSCDKVFFPTGFTPNADNINDDWGFSNIVFLGEFVTLEVFDRWGGEVFRSESSADRWDGTLNGEELMPGQYVYQFTYNCGGEERRKTGSVTMIK